MRTLATDIEQAVDKLHQSGQWTHLVDIVVNTTTTLNYTSYPKQITFQSTTYSPYPIIIGKISQTSKPEFKTLDVSIANIDQTFANLLEKDDLLGNDIKIYWVFIDTSGTAQLALSQTYQMLAAELSDESAFWNFQVGQLNLFSVQFPRNRWIDNRCGHVFKSAGFCNYGRDGMAGVSTVDFIIAKDGSTGVQGWRVLNVGNLGTNDQYDINKTVLGQLHVRQDLTINTAWAASVFTAPFAYKFVEVTNTEVDGDFDVEIHILGDQNEATEGEGILITVDTDAPAHWLKILKRHNGTELRIRGDSSESSVDSNVFDIAGTDPFLRIQQSGSTINFYSRSGLGIPYNLRGTTTNASMASVDIRYGYIAETNAAGRTSVFNGRCTDLNLIKGGYKICPRTIPDCRIRENIRRIDATPGILHGPLIL